MDNINIINQAFAAAAHPICTAITEALNELVGPGIEAQGHYEPGLKTAGILLTGPKVAPEAYKHSLQVLLRWRAKEMEQYLQTDMPTRQSKAKSVSIRIRDLLDQLRACQHVDFVSRTQDKPCVVIADMEDL